MSRRNAGFIMRLIDMIMVVVSLAAVAALAAAYTAPAVNPDKVWYFAFFGLFFPFFYFADLVLTLYWACRWSRMFFVTGIMLFIGVGNISSFYKFPVSKKYHEQHSEKNSIKLLTFNIAGFWDENRENLVTDEILGFIKEQNPDIICFQEFIPSKRFPKDYVDTQLEDWDYFAMNLKDAGGFKAVIYSKFPIISDGEIMFANKNNGVVYADMLVGTDTLRVINNHLQTTHVDKDNVKFLDEYNFTFDEETKDTFMQITERLKRGFIIRAGQADTVSTVIRSRDLPTIVCGDFNDTPMSYVYKTIKGDYKDAFVEKGSGYGFTFKHLYRVLRIDYVLHSQDIQTLSYFSPDVEWSDHNPVIVEFHLTNGAD
ncbi:MAG: endonuclease/exonuclease/phosphatase family protein [Rikenellaceae bacterium]|nr:endonuclease/exonuclease/phosphatase family protein [Rikenellaceae bacterium]